MLLVSLSLGIEQGWHWIARLFSEEQIPANTSLVSACDGEEAAKAGLEMK